MSRSWWMRFSLLVFFIVVAFVHVFPTLANLDLETTKFPFKKKVNLGLDLQGGLYMVYGVDFKKVYRETLDRTVTGLKGDLEKANIAFKFSEIDSTIEENPNVKLTFDAGLDAKVKELYEKHKTNLHSLSEKAGIWELTLSRDYRGLIKDNTLNQSVQVIRGRIDEFGVTEPSITTKGENRLVVELPGVKEVERAKNLIGRTARLEFRMANDSLSPPELNALVTQAGINNKLTYKEGQKLSEYTEQINVALKGKLPEGTVVLFERPGFGQGDKLLPHLLGKVELTGSELQDAFVSFDQQNQKPIVSFQMDAKGAITFEKLTAENIGKRMAIVLDNIVYSDPNIRERIPGGHGQITLGGGRTSGDSFKEARDLAIVLRAGALPAQLDLLEQRVIGPSIGQDSIKRGMTASFVGCLLVFVFMMFYYRGSGVVATVSLILNFMFTFAILIGLDATLTLPGIAGLALTIGMAVDSNVIIFERIRDELHEGKNPVSAIQSGFDKAFACIFDANITHAIVATILLNFGTGPIRGFAVTLLIGIVTTLFCAVTVCKLVFDGYINFKDNKIESLSI